MNEVGLHSIFIDAALCEQFCARLLPRYLPVSRGFRAARDRRADGRRGDVRDADQFPQRVWHSRAAGRSVDAMYLQLIAFIIVIASVVQLVEMFIRKTSPALFEALGIFLPLITTNCAILGLALFQTNRAYDLGQSLVYALGAGVGFTLALVLMAGIREKLALGAVPDLAQGTVITLVVAGILSMAFMGFAGMSV